MQAEVLFRKTSGSMDDEEFGVAEEIFPTRELREDLSPNTLVIGRYSVLPFYAELEKALKKRGSQLINSYSAHKYIADFDYYRDLCEFTFKSWEMEAFCRDAPEGKYVVKGATNSKKFKWQHSMLAQNKAEAMDIAMKLSDDELIGQQKIIFRKFENLSIIEESVVGPPFANEWRFFILDFEIAAKGFYWSPAETHPPFESQCERFVRMVLWTLEQRWRARNRSEGFDFPRFFVLDVAKLDSGGWAVVEMNDGQMSGLSEVDSKELYSNMEKILKYNE